MIAVTTMSCQKDEVKSIVGTWEGNWGFGTETPTNYEKWELMKSADLTVFYDDGGIYAEGSWSVDGVNFEAQYTTIILKNEYSFSGLNGAPLAEIIGNWRSTPSSADGGTFEMFKLWNRNA